jgi:hypothetical protein
MSAVVAPAVVPVVPATVVPVGGVVWAGVSVVMPVDVIAGADVIGTVVVAVVAEDVVVVVYEKQAVMETFNVYD